MKTCFLSIDVEKRERQQKGVFEGVEKLDDILNIFKRHQVHATLFVTGEVLEKYPNLVKKWSEDFEIGCHHYRHITLDKLEPEEKERQIRDFVNLYKDIFGIYPSGFRAPRHSIDSQGFGILEKYGFLYDSSVVPRLIFLHRYSGYKGKAPIMPYCPSFKNYRQKGDMKILEIPDASSFLGIPLAGTWIRHLGVSFFKFLFFLHKPKFVSLAMHSWDAVKFEGKSSKNSGEKFLKQLDELLVFLKKIGYEFKSGEKIYGEFCKNK